ncbi:hypothetical protein F4775DRAFT_597170 [Biscogniauxia sp. FL1348]|nr:hypothetical protein F4775DRAFT_597170 [Biscogniauxia sp. FL1348]
MSYQPHPRDPGPTSSSAYLPPHRSPSYYYYYPPPTNSYNPDSYARAHAWVASQPAVLLPPPPSHSHAARTPVSESMVTDAESNFDDDRRTLGASTLAGGMREKTGGEEDSRVCGIPRRLFCVVLAAGSFLVVVAAAVGLGVGLGSRTAASYGGKDVFRRGKLKLSWPGPVLCPQDNNTMYVTSAPRPAPDVQFERDYGSDAGAHGRGVRPVRGAMECWLKGGLGEPSWSAGWYFACL